MRPENRSKTFHNLLVKSSLVKLKKKHYRQIPINGYRDTPYLNIDISHQNIKMILGQAIDFVKKNEISLCAGKRPRCHCRP